MKEDPDIGETELSCANGFETLHYIDLVNEILENAVCKRKFYIQSNVQEFINVLQDQSTDVPDEIRNMFQSRGYPLTSLFRVGVSENGWVVSNNSWRYCIEKIPEEGAAVALSVYPFPQTGKTYSDPSEVMNLHNAAYDVIKNAVYPFELPFDIWNELVEESLQIKNVKLYEILEKFTVSPELIQFRKEAVVRSYLRTNPEVEQIINGGLIGKDGTSRYGGSAAHRKTWTDLL